MVGFQMVMTVKIYLYACTGEFDDVSDVAALSSDDGTHRRVGNVHVGCFLWDNQMLQH